MSINNTCPTSLEHLPTEIFLQIFASFSLDEVVTIFAGLNSHINSTIRSIRHANHAVIYNDIKAATLLHLFLTHISRLIITNSENVDFTSLNNLRSLTIKYGTLAQLNAIRPQNFPRLEILHICLINSKSLIDKTKTLNDLFQVILSNGFRELRICTTTGVEPIEWGETWTGSPSLRFLILDMQTPVAYDKVRSVCPNLHKFNGPSGSFCFPSSICAGVNKRILLEITKLKTWESEKKFTVEYCSLFDTGKSILTQSSPSTNIPIIRGRIFPEKDPYCFASFLIEIRLPLEYPFKMPEVTILDPIYHINIHKDGRHCSFWGLNGRTWQPTTPLSDIIMRVINVINSPDLNHVCNAEYINEYRCNYGEFNKKALEYTLKYGRSRY